MERHKLYSSQQSNSTFQPQSTRRSPLEQVNSGRAELHSSSTPSNAEDSSRDRTIHKIKAGDTLWEIAEDKLGSGNRWQELQKQDGNGFTEPEARRLQIGTSVYTPGVQPHTTSNAERKPADHSNSALSTQHSALPAKPSQANQPLVGIIDRGFGEGEHGTEVLETIAGVNDRANTWLGRGVGNGGWAESLTEFVDTAKKSGNKQAVANLSFDLTEKRPDGSVTTRSQLTGEEQKALTYARDNGVLIVASAGNQGGAMSALGQASQQFDNIVAVGATEGSDRAKYSSYSKGLDLVAPGSQKGDSFKGTSRSAAEVTGAISQMWAANPTLDYRQVTRALESSATDLQKPGWDTETGAGLLNKTAAVNLAKIITPETQQFSGAQLVQQVKDSPGNSTWKSTNGAVASERSNMLAPVDRSSSSSRSKTKSKPKRSQESSRSLSRNSETDLIQAAKRKAAHLGSPSRKERAVDRSERANQAFRQGERDFTNRERKATGGRALSKASAPSKPKRSQESSRSLSRNSETDLIQAAKRKAAHLGSPSRKERVADRSERANQAFRQGERDFTNRERKTTGGRALSKASAPSNDSTTKLPLQDSDLQKGYNEQADDTRDGIAGMYESVKDPLGTLKTMYNGAKSFVKDPKDGTLKIINGVVEPYKDDWENDRYEKLTGRFLFDTLAIATGAKAISFYGTAIKAEKATGKPGKGEKRSKDDKAADKPTTPGSKGGPLDIKGNAREHQEAMLRQAEEQNRQAKKSESGKPPKSGDANLETGGKPSNPKGNAGTESGGSGGGRGRDGSGDLTDANRRSTGNDGGTSTSPRRSSARDRVGNGPTGSGGRPGNPYGRGSFRFGDITEMAREIAKRHKGISEDEAIPVADFFLKPTTKQDGIHVFSEDGLAEHFKTGQPRPPLPEFIGQRKDGKFVAIEVKNQEKAVDITSAKKKFRSIHDLVTSKYGPNQMGRFELAVKKGFKGFDDANYSVNNKGELVDTTENNSPVLIRGLKVHVVEQNLPRSRSGS